MTKRKRIRTHLTLESRKIIEEKLNEGINVTGISKLLKRDRSNIGREILKHREISITSNFNNSSCCKKKTSCNKYHFDCYKNCKDFEIDLCEKLKASPHVCNGCRTKYGCRKAKYYYKAQQADLQYNKLLVNSRVHMHYNKIELNVLNNDFYNLVVNNKSLYHSLIVINNMGFNFKIKSIYRQIGEGKLRLKKFDLPRTNIKTKTEKKDKRYKRNIEGHTFEDYQKYKETYPLSIEWQMDCVQGIVGKNEPVFLTLQIVEIKFLFIFIISQQKADKVADKLNEFKNTLTTRKINKILNILLTDNGHEFINLEKLNKSLPNTKIFYCHPYSSCEKGSIENNHELIRRVIPQGVSLKCYNEDDVVLLCSHINSLYRKSLNGKCPFDLISKYISQQTLDKLGYKKILEKEVKLIPELLGKKNITNIEKYLTKRDIKKCHIKFQK